MTTMTVTINGKPHNYAEGTVLADVVADITGHDPESDQLGVAVALDAAVVPRSRWTTTTLTSASEVEIITAMQGG